MAKQQAKQVTADESMSDDPAESGNVAVAGDDEKDAEQDHVYGLASVLYHALQGVTAARQYKEDANKAGAADLVEFFEECRAEAAARAKQAKALLVSVSDESDEDADDADDEDDEDDDI